MDFHKRHSIEIRVVIGFEIILFACTFQAGNVTGWGSEGVKSAGNRFFRFHTSF